VAMVLNGIEMMNSKHAEVRLLKFVVRDAYLHAYRPGNNTTTATGKRAVKGGEEWLLLKYLFLLIDNHSSLLTLIGQLFHRSVEQAFIKMESFRRKIRGAREFCSLRCGKYAAPSIRSVSTGATSCG